MNTDPDGPYVRPVFEYILDVDWANNVDWANAARKKSGADPACPRIGTPPYFNETVQDLDEGFNNSYPLPTAHYPQKQFLDKRVEGSYSKFMEVFTKNAGGVVNIVVLGGSFTQGGGCERRLPDGSVLGKTQCAWSGRLHNILQNAFPSTKINLINLAHGGTTSSVVLGGIGLLFKSLGDLRIDIAILDTLVNDASEAAKWGAGSTGKTAEAIVSISYEGLVRALRDQRPETIIVSALAGCGRCMAMKPKQHAIANHYNLPLIDYAEVVAGYKEDKRFWDPPEENHPNWMAHQLMADVIGGVWDSVLQRACANADADSHVWPSAPFNTEEDLAIFPSCKEPLTWISAFEAIKPHSAAMQPSYIDGWRLFEDRPGKPGWISERSDAVMRIPLKFGLSPALSVTYLRSYEGVGDAEIRMNGKGAPLLGLWGKDNREKVSQSFVAWYKAGLNNEGSGFSIAPNQTAELVIKSRGRHKFKLIELSSC